jgi:hypothetical protein
MPIIAWDRTALTWLRNRVRGHAIRRGHDCRTRDQQYMRDHAEELDAGSIGIYVLWETDKPLPERYPGIPSTMGGPLKVRNVSLHDTADLALSPKATPSFSPKRRRQFATPDYEPTWPSTARPSACTGSSAGSSRAASAPKAGEPRSSKAPLGDLRAGFPDMKGLSRSNLHCMRSFAKAWPSVVPQAAGQLPWGHIRELLDKLDDPDGNATPGRPSGTAGAVMSFLIRS